jgi:ssDNA thymidine ADP-ribosyltransferase, DarT
MPRLRLRREQLLEHILTLNAPFRAEEEPWFDRSREWAKYVNLSISEITTNLFRHSLKWHEGKDISWVIMSFDPTLMADDGVFFSTTNNIYPLTERGRGPGALEALFAPMVRRKPGWVAIRGNRPQNLPTCEQAEVLYPTGLPMGRRC